MKNETSLNHETPPIANVLLGAGLVVIYDNEKFRVHSQNEDVKYTLIEDDTRLFQVETRLLRVVQPCT